MTKETFFGAVVACAVVIIGVILSPSANTMLNVSTTGFSSLDAGVVTLLPYLFLGFVILIARKGAK